MPIVNVGIGFMILIAGRPVYPIFVGGMGFLLGSALNSRFNLSPATWNPLIVPVIFAILGFAGAFILRRWAAWAAGFGAGGFLVYTLPQVFEADAGWGSPLTFVIAGALCLALLLIVFDAFLVFLSSLTAATMILTYARIGQFEPAAIFLILMVFGVITQYLVFEYAKPAPD